MPGLNKREAARLLTHIESQGVTVTHTKGGYLLKLPNGETTDFHISGKDQHGPLNLRATLRRAGVTWPVDKSSDIKLSNSTLQKGNKVLELMGYPNAIRGKDFHTAAMINDWNVPNSTIARFLIYHGYEAVGNTVARRFILPDEKIFDEPTVKEAEELPPVAQMELERIERSNTYGKTNLPTPISSNLEVEHREFLDSHDSWVADPDVMPDTLTIKDMKLMFAALSLHFEVRVWK